MACINTFQSCSIARGAKINSRTRGSAGKGSPTFQCRASTFVDTNLRLEFDENPEAIISRVWPENCSLLSYNDLRAYLESQETVQEGDQHVALLSETICCGSDAQEENSQITNCIVTRADVLRELEGLLKI
ncbi:hypothetical protein HU200_002592 [Digitaria exilis]|uniref:Uncharacterized protein n=1 Tax=Digitaria exilis TaxID=1010633 RepID=A0A835KWP8_9POAL|nr:hypothetical protein HU200_002592 [Digitaria exilis]